MLAKVLLIEVGQKLCNQLVFSNQTGNFKIKRRKTPIERICENVEKNLFRSSELFRTPSGMNKMLSLRCRVTLLKGIVSVVQKSIFNNWDYWRYDDHEWRLDLHNDTMCYFAQFLCFLIGQRVNRVDDLILTLWKIAGKKDSSLIDRMVNLFC